MFKEVSQIAIVALLGFSAAAYDNYGAAQKAGETQFRERKYEEAAAAFSEAVQLADTHDEKYRALDRMAVSYTTMRKYEEEEKVLQDMLAMPGITPSQKSELYYRLGWNLRRQPKKWEPAVQAFEAGANVEPAGPYTHSCIRMYGDSFRHMRQYDKAIEILEKLLAMPDVTPATKYGALQSCASSYQGLKKYDEALQKFDILVAMQGEKGVTNDAISSAWTGKGMCLNLMKKTEEAEAAFISATTVPDLKPVAAANAYLELGRFYQAQKNLEKAKAAYAKSVEISPNPNNQKALSALE